MSWQVHNGIGICIREICDMPTQTDGKGKENSFHFSNIFFSANLLACTLCLELRNNRDKGFGKR